MDCPTKIATRAPPTLQTCPLQLSKVGCFLRHGALGTESCALCSVTVLGVYLRERRRRIQLCRISVRAAACRTYGTGSWSVAAMALAYVVLPKASTACRRTHGAGSSSLVTMAAAWKANDAWSRLPSARITPLRTYASVSSRLVAIVAPCLAIEAASTFSSTSTTA